MVKTQMKFHQPESTLFAKTKTICRERNSNYFEIITCDLSIYGPRREKTCLRGFGNNKDADQPAHLHSLISAFVIHLLESIISRLATSEISIFELVLVAVKAGLNLTLSGTQKTGFLASRPIF